MMGVPCEGVKMMENLPFSPPLNSSTDSFLHISELFSFLLPFWQSSLDVVCGSRGMQLWSVSSDLSLLYTLLVCMREQE